MDKERELRSLTDNSPDLLTRFDREFRHVFVNAAVERVTGLQRLDVLGKTNRELGMPPELCDLWDSTLGDVFETGEHNSFEFNYNTASGPKNFATQLAPEFGLDGQVEYVLGVTHDITHRKLFEQTLADQDRRKDEFLATLAHELRNPLAPIRTGLQVMKLAPPNSPAIAELERSWSGNSDTWSGSLTTCSTWPASTAERSNSNENAFHYARSSSTRWKPANP